MTWARTSASMTTTTIQKIGPRTMRLMFMAGGAGAPDLLLRGKT